MGRPGRRPGSGGEGGGFDERPVLEPRDSLQRAQHRSPASLVRLGLQLAREFNRLEPFDRAMTLAAQAFTSIFPVVIVTFSFLPPGCRPARRPGGGHARPPGSTRSPWRPPPGRHEQAATFGLLGLLIVLVSATSFSRALTRMYAKAWSVRRRAGAARGAGSPRSWRSPLRTCSQVVAAGGEGSDAGVAGALLLTFLVNTVLWTWVPSVLLAAEVPWRYLAPGGALMGAATVVRFFASRIYMPHALEYAAEKFGELGVAFTYIGWLFAVAFALIVATVIGVVLAREPGPVSRFLASRASGSGSATAPPEHMSSGTSEAARAERDQPESEQ